MYRLTLKIALRLSALILLTACVPTSTEALRSTPSVGPVAYLHTGPFEPGELSQFQTFAWFFSDPEYANPFSKRWTDPFSEQKERSVFEQTGKPVSAVQTRMHQHKNALVWRLYLYGPDIIAAQSHQNGDGYIGVDQGFRLGSGDRDRTFLGYVNFKEMKVVETPLGQALDSGWIWSPVSYGNRMRQLRKQGNTDKTLDYQWKYYNFDMKQNRPVFVKKYDDSNQTIKMYWMNKPEEVERRDLKERVKAQLRGDEALATYKDAERYYSQNFRKRIDNELKRDAIIAWMKERFDPVAPYAVLYRVCGSLPSGWRESNLGNIVLGDNDSAVQEARKLNEYTNCLTRLMASYDVAPYAKIYPKVKQKVAEWKAAGGKLVTEENVPSNGYISGFASVEPNLVGQAFEQRLDMVSNPNSDARRSAKLARRDAADERIRREKRRLEREKQKQRQAAATRAQFLANQASINAMQNQVNQISKNTAAIASGSNSGTVGNVGSGSNIGGGSITLTSRPNSGRAPSTEQCDAACLAKIDAEVNRAHADFVEEVKQRNEGFIEKNRVYMEKCFKQPGNPECQGSGKPQPVTQR